MQVVITKAQLDEQRACSAYLKSPEWDAGQQALVYSDWDATVARLLSSRIGTVFLDFLVVHGLVPMTVTEFIDARARARSQ